MLLNLSESKIIYCPTCGTECKSIQKFCMNCGTSLVVQNDTENEEVNDTEHYEYQVQNKLPIKLLLASILIFIVAAMLLWVAVNNTIYQEALNLLGFDSLIIALSTGAFTVLGIIAILIGIGIIRNDYRAYIFGIIFSCIVIPLSLYFGVKTAYIFFWMIGLIQFIPFIIVIDEKRAIDQALREENEVEEKEEQPSVFGNIVTIIGIILFLILLIYAMIN